MELRVKNVMKGYEIRILIGREKINVFNLGMKFLIWMYVIEDFVLWSVGVWNENLKFMKFIIVKWSLL